MFIWRPSGQRDSGVVIKKGQKYSSRFPLTDLYVTAKIKRIFPENKPSGRLKPATSGERESQDESARRFLLLINFKVLKSCFFVPDSWSCRGLPSLSAENKLSLLFYARSFSGTFLLFLLEWKTWRKSTVKGPFVLFRLTISWYVIFSQLNSLIEDLFFLFIRSNSRGEQYRCLSPSC